MPRAGVVLDGAPDGWADRSVKAGLAFGETVETAVGIEGFGGQGGQFVADLDVEAVYRSWGHLWKTLHVWYRGLRTKVLRVERVKKPLRINACKKSRQRRFINTFWRGFW